MSVRLLLFPKGLVASICSGPQWGQKGLACVSVVGNQQTNLHVTVLRPDEQPYRRRILSELKGCRGGEQAGPRGRHFIPSPSRWRSWGLSCLKERAGNARGAKCWWLEARLHSCKCSPVCCSEDSPPAPASPSLDVPAGPGPAWWMPAFGDGLD